MKPLAKFLILVLTFAAGFTIALGEAGANDREEVQRKAYWQKRYAMVLSRKAEAEVRIEESQTAIRKLRQRDRNKGEPRAKILTELESAEKELATVMKLLAEFPDSARQAGVPPGWLREVEERQGSES